MPPPISIKEGVRISKTKNIKRRAERKFVNKALHSSRKRTDTVKHSANNIFRFRKVTVHELPNSNRTIIPELGVYLY